MKPLTARTNDESEPVPEDSLRARRIGLVADDSLWDGGLLPRGAISTDALLHIHVHSAELPPAAEQRMLDAIVRPHGIGESRAEANTRRERELLEVFGELTPAQACQLRKRLDNDRSDDRLVVAFKRLIIERRQRLYAALVGRRR
jgi:hypothetical protein